MTTTAQGARRPSPAAALRLCAYLLAELTRAQAVNARLRAELHQLRSSRP